MVWNEECEGVFKALKNVLCSDPVLNSPNFKKGFIVQMDTSDRGVGAVLYQAGEDGQEHPVEYLVGRYYSYGSYSTIECLTIKLELESFKVYLLGLKFLVQTNHRALEWRKENNARLSGGVQHSSPILS